MTQDEYADVNEEKQLLEWLLSDAGSNWFYWEIEHGRRVTVDSLKRVVAANPKTVNGWRKMTDEEIKAQERSIAQQQEFVRVVNQSLRPSPEELAGEMINRVSRSE